MPSQYFSIRHRLWRMMHDQESPQYHKFDALISWLIIISCVQLALDPFVAPGVAREWFDALDQAMLLVFLLEYSVRLWSVDVGVPKTVVLKKKGQLLYQVMGRLRHAIRPMSLIDLAALLALVPWLRSLRTLRLLRLMRTFRFFRYHDPLKTLASVLKTNTLLMSFIFGIFFTATTVGGLGFYQAEGGINPKVEGISDGIYWALVTLTTVGYGDISPVTPSGRVVASVLMLTGMGLLALFTGVISQTLVGHIMPLQKEQVRMSTLANHLVICGWNDNVPHLLKELKSEYSEKLPNIVIFAPCPRPEDLDESFTFIQGEPTRESELDKVRLAFAEKVIVVGHQARMLSSNAVDAHTVLTLFTIRSFERKLLSKKIQRLKPLHLCCEIHDPENSEHAKTAGADEIVLTSRLSSGLLAHASAYPGMSTVFAELLDPQLQNIYIEKLPENFFEEDLSSLSFRALHHQLKDQFGALLIGFKDKGGIVINPSLEKNISVEANLIYLADRPISRKS